MRGSAEWMRTELAARLQVARPEVEQAAMSRICAISDPADAADPAYLDGLRTAVSAAFDYGLAGIECGTERPPQIPTALLAQARMAARSRVSLDTVLRRYFAGYTLLGDALVEEAEKGKLVSRAELRHILRAQATLFDRLIATVAEEHTRESDSHLNTSEERRAALVEGLLASELLDPSELAYDFELVHVGVIAAGPGAEQSLRELTTSIDGRLLTVRHSESSAWAWLGSRRDIDPAELERIASATLSPQVVVAIGEPAQGLDGWRLTHQQARTALPIAMHGSGNVARYADVALLAATLQDEVLATSLRRLYLEPLAEARDDGQALRETLRAYFTAGRNISSAAASLGVKRHTVTNRLRVIEELLGRPLNVCSADLDIALRLEGISDPLPPRGMPFRS